MCKYFYCYISVDNERGNGVVISNRPLKNSELFEVRITDMTDKWGGWSIKVGITALQSDTMEILTTMYGQSNTWMMSGCYIKSGNEELKIINYGINLNSLKVCMCMCVCVSVRVYKHTCVYKVCF